MTPVWKETSVHATCAVHRVPGFYCFPLFPIVSRCTSAVHRNLTFHAGCDVNKMNMQPKISQCYNILVKKPEGRCLNCQVVYTCLRSIFIRKVKLGVVIVFVVIKKKRSCNYVEGKFLFQ